MKNYVFLILLFLLSTLPSAAFDVQKINLDQNQTYMIIFDKSVKNYTLNNDDSIKIELLNNLFNDKTQMLLTPLNKKASSLTVNTEDNTYFLEICVNGGTALQNITEDDQLDLPPGGQNNNDFSGFSLDSPPEMR
jgi:hypothetical protein